MRGRLTAGQRTLNPFILVRIQTPQQVVPSFRIVKLFFMKIINLFSRIFKRGSADLKISKSIPDWSEVREEVMSKITRFNQRDIPACVAHTTVTLMQIEWYRRTGKIINFSPRFLDILSWTNDLGLHDGRDPNVVMDLSVEVGCCTEDLLPNDTTLPIEKYRDRSVITKAMMKEAAKYRMASLGLNHETLFDNR